MPTEPKNITPARVLVIDDEESIRDGVEQILSRQGYQVVTAPDGRSGLDLLDREPFQVVLLDLRMPGMDGYEVLNRIKEADQEADVIIMTAHGTIETAVDTMRMGAIDFLTKPFIPWHLKQVVGRAVTHRRLQEEHQRLVAERARGLRAITTEKSRLKSVINSMSEGVMIAEQDKNIVMCNPAFTRLLALDQVYVDNSNLADHQELVAINQMADRLLGAPPEMKVLVEEIAVQGSRLVYLRASLSRVEGERAETLGLVTVLEDLTLHKEAEHRKADFVNMVTHELRAPLGTVDTQLSVILRGIPGPLSGKQRDMLERMKGRVGGLLELISNLLDLAKIEDQRLVRRKCLIELNEVVREGCALLAEQASAKGLDLAMFLNASLPRVLADPQGIRDVVVNLVSNAIRYSLQEGGIEVSTGLEAGYVYFAVQDTGIGIAKQDQERIFDRFFRVKSEQTRHIVGTGLGLPIVKAIVDDHRGQILVESEPGKGATFTVRLPREV